MAKQTINIGSTANDGTGSTLRVGGDIINDNFNEIYTAFGDGSTLTSGFVSATGFALYTVTIRWKPETPKFTTVVLAGFFCALFAFFILGFSFEPFTIMPEINSYLSLLHGFLVAAGLILYSLGAKYLPSAELALLSLMEVVGGISVSYTHLTLPTKA